LESLQPAVNAVEAGLLATWGRLSSGRLKVFSNLQNWLSEFRIYRRDESGRVVKANDHLMDCTRYLVMSGLSRAAALPSRLWTDREMPGGIRRNGFTSNYDPLGYGQQEEPYGDRIRRLR
jgi:hypothetical protein